MLKKTGIFVFLIIISFVSSCAAAPDSIERDGIRVASGGNPESNTEAGEAEGSGLEKNEIEEGRSQEVDRDEEADREEETDGAEDVEAQYREEKAEEQYREEITENAISKNNEIFASADGNRIARSIKRTDGRELLIDAEINTAGIERVSRYRYILQPVTEEIRQTMFQALFPSRISEIEYDERNHVWTLKNSEKAGDYWLHLISFSNGGATIAGEEILVLEYRYYDLYPFEDNRFKAVSDSKASVSAEEAAEACRYIVDEITGGADFTVDYIHAYGTAGRRPYYKIVFKYMLDGMPVTIYNNLSFLYDNDGLAKMWGALFSVEETGIETSVLTVEEAVDVLESQADFLNFEGEANMVVSRITPEYLALISAAGEPEIVPVWRFWLGEDEDERNYLRQKILAIHALTGELIWEERGDTF